MDPHPHPLLHFLVRMKPTSTNDFLQIAKNVEDKRGKIWAIQRMLKCFPAKSLNLIPHQIGSMETGVIIQKHSRAFRLYGAWQHPQPPRNEPYLSALLCLPPFPSWTNALYTTLTSRTIKKQLCGPESFHYACILPCRWLYRYVTTVLPALRGMFFMASVRFSYDYPSYMCANANVCVCVCVCV